MIVTMDEKKESIEGMLHWWLAHSEVSAQEMSYRIMDAIGGPVMPETPSDAALAFLEDELGCVGTIEAGEAGAFWRRLRTALAKEQGGD